MTWRRLKCDSCKATVTIRCTLLQQTLQTQQTVNCCRPHCSGIMSPTGKIITRRATVERGSTYEFQQARSQVRRRSDVSYAEEDSDDESSAKRTKLDSDDFDYAPAEQYTPSMRFTSIDMERNLRSAPPTGLQLKSTGRVNIQASVSGEREKSTNDQMGGSAAWFYARAQGAPNAGRYKLGSQDYYEWCHLQGVSLGGYTRANNLAAGHYAVNTYMSVIEEYLRGKTAFQIEVIAHCNVADIADFLVYNIYRIRDGRLAASLPIDGYMTYFSANDRNRVRADLKRLGV